MIKMKKGTVVLLALVLCAPTMALVTNHNAESIAWAQDPEFDNVAYGILYDDDGIAYRGGTATVVWNNNYDGTWLIATAHQIPTGFDPTYGFGSNLLTGLANGDNIAADAIFFHATLDLALIRLEDLVPGIEALPFYGDTILEGQEVRFAGYGDHGLLSQANQNGAGGTGLFDGERRAAIGRDIGSAAFLGQPYSNIFEGDTGLLLAGIAQTGDSGSGIRIVENDIEYLAGVIRSGRGTGLTAWTTYVTLTPDVQDWITGTIAANPYDPTAPVPEPATLMLLAMGCLGLVAKAGKDMVQ